MIYLITRMIVSQYEGTVHLEIYLFISRTYDGYHFGSELTIVPQVRRALTINRMKM